MSQHGLIAEWRAPTGHIVGYTAGGLFLCALAIGVQVAGVNKGPAWLMLAIGLFVAATSIIAVINALTQRVRLFDDRIESMGLGGGQTLLRRDILGRRREHDGDFRLVHRDNTVKGMTLPQRVMKVPALLAWLETLDDLDAADYLKEEEQLEADERLGSTASTRRETLVMVRRWCRVGNIVGIGIAVWALVFPRPYEISAVACILAPVVATVIAARWQAAISLVYDGENWPGGDLVGLWMIPSLAMAMFGVRELLVDWQAPLLVALAPAALMVAAVALADQRARNPGYLLFCGLVAFGWAWGALAFSNDYLDHRPPKVIEARVEARDGEADDSPRLTLASSDLPHRLDSLDVSAERFIASPVGATVCLNLYRGRFGWRYAILTDCPATPAPTE